MIIPSMIPSPSAIKSFQSIVSSKISFITPTTATSIAANATGNRRQNARVRNAQAKKCVILSIPRNFTILL